MDDNIRNDYSTEQNTNLEYIILAFKQNKAKTWKGNCTGQKVSNLLVSSECKCTRPEVRLDDCDGVLWH